MSTRPVKRPKLEQEEEEYMSDPQRPSGSCETCKNRKVRCDRTKPSCNWCQKNKVECVYKTKKKPGLKPGFGKELTSRIATVEYELAKHNELIYSLKEQVEYWKQQSKHPLPQYPRLDNQSPVSVQSTGSTVQSDGPVPDNALVRELVDLYFVHIHPQFPILHPESTKRWLEGHICQHHTQWPILLYSIITVTLRYIPTTRIEQDVRNKYHEYCKDKVVLQCLNVHSMARLQALVVLALELIGVSNGPETWGVLALISAAATQLGLSKEAGLGSPVDSSNIATRNHEVLPESTNSIELESRRRLFWGVYMLDRFSAVSTSFAFRINETEINRMLPVTEKLWVSKNTSELPKTRWLKTPNRTDYTLNNVQFVDPFGYLVELLQILGSIHKFLREPINIQSLTEVIDWQMRYRQLGQELEDWFRSIPSECSDLTQLFVNSWNPMTVLLHATYLTSVIRLHSAAGYSFLKSEFFTTSPSAAQKCLQAVRGMTFLTKHIKEAGAWEYMGPSYSWCVWVSARLLLVDCVTTHKKFPEELEEFIQHLKQLGKYWKVAARYREILNLVIDEELSLRTNKGSVHNGQESKTKIFSDMRHNAYALDFLLSNDKKEEESPPSPPPTSDNVEPETLNGVFDWFNWPKALDVDDTVVHSVDEYKNILSKDEPFGYSMLGAAQQDWLQQ